MQYVLASHSTSKLTVLSSQPPITLSPPVELNPPDITINHLPMSPPPLSALHPVSHLATTIIHTYLKEIVPFHAATVIGQLTDPQDVDATAFQGIK
jgi:hypothetical protein